MSGKIVILAGGISSRMKNSAADAGLHDENLIRQANSLSKSMMTLGSESRPFMDYLLLNISRAGYDDVVIVVNEKDSAIRNYYEKTADTDFLNALKISFAVQKIPEGREKPLGTADALLSALISREDWKGGRFAVCNSDNLYSVTALKIILESKYRNSMIDYDRAGFEFEKDRTDRFAVTVKDDDGFLTDIVEKPSAEEIRAAESAGGFVGVSMNLWGLDYDMIFPFLEKAPMNTRRNEKELPSAIKMMIAENPESVFAFRLKEHVPDLTSKEDILKVRSFLSREFHNLF